MTIVKTNLRRSRCASGVAAERTGNEKPVLVVSKIINLDCFAELFVEKQGKSTKY